ncbi:MAG TPA: DUF368 domain-containing protein [Gammaproteobacteria bacterium]|nr:DUF368 domain-containing protein [Gammaproteobacteria bacterium]|tara:strand:- start:203 stop:1144 length:942 start_codon:yes stop_codon:yes gene_type:complete
MNPGDKKSSLRNAVIIASKGFCIGAADIVPGVSGGTMAFILGIYTRLIDALNSFDTTWVCALLKLDFRSAVTRPHFQILLPLGAGLLGAVIFFTQIIPIPSLLRTYPEYVYSLFFGLIIGSIFILLIDIGWKSLSDWLYVLVGTALGGFLVTAVPAQTPDEWWFVMVSGAIAICAMVLPGISGSFILLILGKYVYVLEGVGSLNLGIIVPFIFGAGVGLIAFTRLLSWLLRRYERPMLLIIAGFLVASLWVIWPFQQRHYASIGGTQRLVESSPVAPPWNTITIEASLLALIGITIVLLAGKLAKTKTDTQEH